MNRLTGRRLVPLLIVPLLLSCSEKDSVGEEGDTTVINIERSLENGNEPIGDGEEPVGDGEETVRVDDTVVKREKSETPVARDGSNGTDTTDRPRRPTTGNDRPIVGMITAVGGERLPSLGQVDFSLVPVAAPDIEWKIIGGERGSLKDFRGSVLLVNFWGTWCPPCRKELPDIVAVRDEFRDRGFEVIGVAVNERPTAGRSIPENLIAFATANGLHYPLVIADPEGKVSTWYGQPPSVPTTFVVNRRGQVVDVLVGARSAEEFRNAVAPHL